MPRVLMSRNHNIPEPSLRRPPGSVVMLGAGRHAAGGRVGAMAANAAVGDARQVPVRDIGHADTPRQWRRPSANRTPDRAG